MAKEISFEEMVEIVEGFGWDYAESSDGTGDMFVYWDHLNGDMPDWAGDNITSCECLETIYDMYIERKLIMKKRIWITKNWKNACTVTIWTEKPVWYPNKKHKQPHDNGYWGRKDDGSLNHSSCIFHDSLSNLFKVKFTKNRREGYIAERILTMTLPERR